MIYKIQKKQIICIMVAMILSAMVTGYLLDAKTTKVQKGIADEVFRFHVLANSDSENDQALKLKVKDNVITYMKEELPGARSAEMTKAWSRKNLQKIEEVAKETLRQEGCDYPVKAEVTSCYFPDKTYGDVTFPEGEYEALRIEIGAAKGQNWWCVLYPNLCFIDAVHAVVPDEGKRELKEVLDEEEYEMVTTTSKFKVKWFFFR